MRAEGASAPGTLHAGALSRHARCDAFPTQRRRPAGSCTEVRCPRRVRSLSCGPGCSFCSHFGSTETSWTAPYHRSQLLKVSQRSGPAWSGARCLLASAARAAPPACLCGLMFPDTLCPCVRGSRPGPRAGLPCLVGPRTRLSRSPGPSEALYALLAILAQRMRLLRLRWCGGAQLRTASMHAPVRPGDGQRQGSCAGRLALEERCPPPPARQAVVSLRSGVRGHADVLRPPLPRNCAPRPP